MCAAVVAMWLSLTLGCGREWKRCGGWACGCGGDEEGDGALEELGEEYGGGEEVGFANGSGYAAVVHDDAEGGVLYCEHGERDLLEGQAEHGCGGHVGGGGVERKVG